LLDVSSFLVFGPSAILQHNKEDFEDCDHSELVYGLTHLQAMDMDKV
jgi:hypothetical protein